MHQMPKRVILIVFGIASILLAWMSFGSGHAFAESGDQLTKGLTVSPLRTEAEVAPGTSQDKTLSITNNNKTPITVRLSAEEFSVINQQYDYAFNIETELVKWVTFASNTIEVAPGETKSVAFRIGVPIDAEPGGRYISMFASTEAGSAGDGSTSRQRVGSLIYLTVIGNVSRVGQLVSLSAPWFVASSTDWRAALQNTGTTHYYSRYNVVIQDMFGGTQSSTTVGEALILPGTVRSVSDAVPLPRFPGIYKLTYTIGLGDTPAKVETRYMIYLPTAAIVVIIFAAILIVALVGEYRSRKRHA